MRIDDIVEGTTWEESALIPSNGSISEFARSIKDLNPPHHDKEAAMRAGYKDVIAPWVMSGGLISSMVTRHISGVVPGRVDMRLRRPVYAGTVVTIICTVTKRREKVAKATVTIKDELGVLVMPLCTLILPKNV